MSCILVTGGAGYIGSHTVHALVDRGDRVTVLDDLSTGHRAFIPRSAEFVFGDAGDRDLVSRLIRQHEIDAVIHFAGSIVVPESVTNPLRYYANNTCASRNLIEACVHGGVRRFVFSSTAAVYGMADAAILPEETPTAPISPYGRSKLMTEWMLQDAAAAHDFDFVALRYFNVSGADPEGRTGQSSPNATHLIKRASLAALGRLPHVEIFGTDYPTHDGTGVRDYIHVSDLAEAHVLAVDALRRGLPSSIFNCGYGRGLSVRDIIAAVERCVERKIPTVEAPRRAGDPPIVVADPSKLKRTLNWQPHFADVDLIVRSSLDWERQLQAQHTAQKERPATFAAGP